MKNEAQRRAFVADPKLELVEILDEAVVDGREINNESLQSDIVTELKRYRAEHGRKGRNKLVRA